MNNFDECFARFFNTRLDAINEKLKHDDFYTISYTRLYEIEKKIDALISPENFKLYDEYLSAHNTICACYEETAYKMGFADALKFLAAMQE